MLSTLSIGDFTIRRSVCELRYDDAYLLFDRTGAVVQELKTHFPSISVNSASPNSTTLHADEGIMVVELGQCRLTAERPETSLESFSKHCGFFFRTVMRHLEIPGFDRIGLRVIYQKKCKDLAEARASLNTLDLLKLEKVTRFGASETPIELLFRFQGDSTGTTVRLHTENGRLDLTLPTEFESEKPKIHKELNSLILDVDYYTVAHVESDQWNPETWIPQTARIIRKESDKILGQ